MQHAHDHQRFRILAIENAVREPSQSSATRFAMEHAIRLWILANTLNRRGELFAKLCPETRFLSLIPAIRVQNIGARLAPKDRSLHFDGPPSS